MLSQLGEESLQRKEKSASLNKRKTLHERMKRKGLLVMIWCAQRTLEEMQQYENHFKLPLEIHDKYVNLLSEDMDEGEESRFEAVDEVVFTQKH